MCICFSQNCLLSRERKISTIKLGKFAIMRNIFFGYLNFNNNLPLENLGQKYMLILIVSINIFTF